MLVKLIYMYAITQECECNVINTPTHCIDGTYIAQNELTIVAKTCMSVKIYFDGTIIGENVYTYLVPL